MKTFRDLIVWQKSFKLVVVIYRITDGFPKSEIYGLTSQIRRAAVAIPSNIAEGQSRGHRAEYIQFLQIAKGSSAELETQLFLAKELKFVSEKSFKEAYDLLVEVEKMLTVLINTLRYAKA